MYSFPDGFHIVGIAGEENRLYVKVFIALLVVREVELHLVGLRVPSHFWSTRNPAWD
jgi:hypothetical protein